MASFSGTLERRNNIGIGWSSRHVTLEGVTLHIHEKDGPISLKLSSVSRQDATTAAFSGSGHEIALRASAPDIMESLIEAAHTAMIEAKIIEPTNAGLPAEDPRNGLKFAVIPVDYAAKFSNLEKAVLYWFKGITKFGNATLLSKKRKVEERIGFLGDKAFYVTRPNSEITRCIKVEKMQCLYTNAGSKDLQGKNPFLVIRAAKPEFDLCFESTEILPLIRALKVLYRLHFKGRDLKVTQTSSFEDPVVELNLVRSDDFEMVMVVPSTKKQLRRRLDAYYKEHGITPPPTAPSKKKEEQKQEKVLEKKEPTKVESKPNTQEESVPLTDPLGAFLSLIERPQYYMVLYKQNLDLDLLDCMDDTDFKNFGVCVTADIALIQEKLQDKKFMAAVEKLVESSRSDASWKAKPVINQRQVVSLSDDEDDLQISSPSPTSRMPINLDSDDDLALPPPKAPIILDDDDL